MTIHLPFAASASLPALPATLQCASGGAARTNLPTWAQNNNARALLALVRAERPARNRPIAVTLTGDTASLGYRGRNADGLRKLFDAAFGDMLLNSTIERDALVAWREANNADALIARSLGEAL